MFNDQNFLTPHAIETFKRDGIIRVPKLLHPPVVERWRAMLGDLFGPITDDSAMERMRSYGDTDIYRTRLSFVEQGNLLSDQKMISRLVHQLGGGNFSAEDNGWIVRWPDPAQSLRLPRIGHIDVFPNKSFPNDWYPFMLGISTYLYDVDVGCGATMFWPGSHVTVHNYLIENPHHVDGTFREQMTPNEVWRRFTHGMTPYEAVGEAGDVFFWHSLICHSVSGNKSRRPRIALFARCRHQQQSVISRQVPKDIWRYWGV
jgi:hypothetical protein